MSGEDGVVLLHGIFRTRRSMRAMEKFLRSNGYRTLNITYPSRRQPIESLAEHIRPEVEAFAAAVPGKVHMVGHSMGGLIARAYFSRFAPGNAGCIVQLGAPNHGSEIADAIHGWKIYKILYGPAGQQLVTRYSRADEILGKVNHELGSIAGTFSLEPAARFFIRGPHDGTVSVESTRVEGMKDHVTVSASHTFFTRNRKAWRQTLAFLKTGQFER